MPVSSQAPVDVLRLIFVRRRSSAEFHAKTVVLAEAPNEASTQQTLAMVRHDLKLAANPFYLSNPKYCVYMI
jgi:hypothetical protein